MEVVMETARDVAIATVAVEELDASNVAEFKRELAPILQEHGKVILDLTRLRFVDSSGLGAMISSLRQLTAKGGDLKLCCLTSQVRSAFELMRMHRVFDIFATQQEALGAFGH